MQYIGKITDPYDLVNKKYVDEHSSTVDVDGVTIDKNADDELEVKDGGISINKIAGSVIETVVQDTSTNQRLAGAKAVYDAVKVAGHTFTATIDSTTYVMSMTLKDRTGAVLSTQTIDLPLESMVVNVEYIDTTAHPKSLKITLQNGTVTYVPVGDMVDGLVPITRKVAGYALSSDVTAQQIETATKDLTTTFTNKTIDASNNTIHNISGTNFMNKGTSNYKKVWAVQSNGSTDLTTLMNLVDTDDTTIGQSSNKLTLLDNAVGTNKIKNEAVTLAKLAKQTGNEGKYYKIADDGTTELEALPVMETGQIGEFKMAPFLLDNFIAFDGSTNYSKTGTYEDLYNVLSTKCPNLLLPGGSSNLFKLVDLTNRYVKLDKNGDGSLGNESLPDHQHKIRSCFGAEGSAYSFEYTHPKASAWTEGKSETAYVSTDYPNSVYKVGAKVNPDHITMIPQVRYKVDKTEPMNAKDIFDILRPIGSHFIQYGSSDNPNTLFGTYSTWEKVNLEQAYIQFDSTATAGTAVSESLPNITGSLGLHGAENGSFFAGNSGALGYSSMIGYYKYANYQGGANSAQGITFNAHSSNSVYQDGGKVHPQGQTAVLWVRTE